MRKGSARQALRALLLACWLGPGVARADPSNPRDDAPSQPSERSAAPYGMIVPFAGLTSLRSYSLAIDDAEPIDGAEGEASGSITYGLQYVLPIVPYFAARAFVQKTSFETDLSESSAVGWYEYYDFGVAPALSFALGRAQKPFLVLLSVPVSFTLGRVERDPPRAVIREHWTAGHGYRIGLSASGVLIVARHFGVLMAAEISRTQVDQPLEYRALDGSGRTSEQNLRYTSTWVAVTAGLAWVL
jgi:hypothetical protein